MADNPEGISIHEVAEKMGIHRNTAAKYLEILHSQGLVEVKKVGVTKLYSPSRRIPVSCVLHLFSEPVFGIDRGNIIRVVNTAALEMIGLSREECIGRSITLLDDLICNGISDGIIPSLRGTPCSCTLTRQTRGTRIVFAIRGIPVQLDSGRSGAAVIIKSATSPEGLIARLEYAEKMLDLFMALSDPIIVTFSESFEISFANEGFIRSCMPTGSSGKEGFLPFDMFIHDRDRFLDTLEKARETGEWSAVLRIIHSSGDIRLYQWTFHADHEGSWQYLAIGRDQTEHYYEKEQFSQFLESTEMLFGKRTQDLREINRRLFSEISERRQTEETLKMYEYTLRNVGDLVFWFTSDGLVTFYNTAARDMLNIPDKTDQLWISSFFPHPPFGDWNIFYSTLREQGSIVLETCMMGTPMTALPVEIRFTLIPYGGREYCCCIARDIQGRVQALDSLVESESRFRELAETISDVVYVRDLISGKIEYLNQAYEEIYQRPVQELYTDPDSWSASVHADDYDRVIAQAGVPEADRKTMEYRIIRPSGEIRWVRAKIHYVRDADNRPIREIGVVTDFTHEKRTQDEIRQLHERFRLAVHAAPVTIFGQDPDMVYQWIVNPSINLNISDIVGFTDYDIFPSDTAFELYTIKKRVIETGEEFTGECSIRFGGKTYPTQIYLRPFRNEYGGIAGLIGAAIDIRNIVHQKRRYTLNEQRYRRLFDAMQEGYVVFSPVRSSFGQLCDFCISDLNRFAVKKANRPKKELIGRKLSDFRPDIDPRWRDSLLHVAQSGEEVRFDGYSGLFGGYYSFHAFSVGEELIGVVIRDITDQMRSSEHLQAHRDLARELSATTDMHHALDLILRTALDVPGIDSGGLYLLHGHDAAPVLRLHCHAGLSEEYISAVTDMVVTDHILALFENKAPRYISRSDPAAEKIRPLLEKEGIISYVLIPLYEQGDLVGCLNLASHTLSEIPPRERPFLEALSGWLGKTLVRFIHDDTGGSKSGYAVIKSDGVIIEGTLWNGRTTAPGSLFGHIQKNHAALMTGKEITCPGVVPGSSYQIRFCPWGDEVAFLVRSGMSRS